MPPPDFDYHFGVGMKYVFDNSNLNESYAGVVSPLTFSFCERVYASVYQQFCRLMGVNERTVKAHSDTFSSMLARIGGRLYYNLASWHQMIALMPMYALNGPFLEDMMGIDTDNRQKVTAQRKSKLTAGVMSGFVTVRIMCIFLTMDWWHHRFERTFQKKYQNLKARLGRVSDPKTVLQEYFAAESELTADFSVPIANDFSVMVSVGLLKLFVQRTHPEVSDELARSLGGAIGLKSAEPGKAMAKLLQTIKAQSSLREYFVSESPTKILKQLRSDSASQEWQDINAQIDQYLNEYGYRVPAELKLETVGFVNDPVQLLALLRSQLSRESKSGSSTGGPSSTQEPDSPTPKTTTSIDISGWSWQDRWLFSTLLRWSRAAIARRESTRFQRTLIYGLARDAFMTTGQALAADGKIHTARDVLYLSIPELERVVFSDTSFRPKALIKKRKKEEAYFRTLDMPEHIELPTFPPTKRMLATLTTKTKRTKNQTASRVAQGMVASTAGKKTLTGTALVVTDFDPSRDYSNKVLVTRQTDPGWTIIFPELKALIVERGGMLSHASIVAREFELPCIVGVENATEIFKSGQKLRLDLLKGRVRLG